MTMDIAKRIDSGPDFNAIETWKKKRRIIVSELVKTNLRGYELFQVPSNRIRTHQKIPLHIMSPVEQELVLFNDFLTVCRGANTGCLQCELDDKGEKLNWIISGNCDESVTRWLSKCFHMGTNLFELELCISRLHSDLTRGPVVYTFCSVVLKYLRKTYYPELVKLEHLPSKNILTLQRHCIQLNQVIEPLKDMAMEIERCDLVGGEMINFLFEQSQSDERCHIADLLKKVLSLALARYCDVIFEWISQCTLTLDLGHEFFIWDLSRVKGIKREDFTTLKSDGTEFDKRFVVIDELCPEIFKPVAGKIVEVGMYLFTMKMQGAGINLLSSQLTMDANMFHNKSVGEMRIVLHDVHSKCSLNILRHLEDKFDIRTLALSLPRYFLSVQSAWIEELVTIYENTQFYGLPVERIHPHNLQYLLDSALDNDCLKDDRLRSKFELRCSEFYSIDEKGTPHLELRINWDPSLRMAIPQKVLEPYQRLFRLSFLLHRVRHLLSRKRFFDADFRPDRSELAALFLIIRFVSVYHSFVFSTVLGELHTQFVQKLKEAKSLEAMVAAQHDFLCAICDRARLDMEKTVFAEAMVKLLTVFTSYAKGELNIKETEVKAGPIICRLKKILMQSNDYSVIRTLLFGSNFGSIWNNKENVEPLWVSLKHIAPALQN